MGRRRGDRVRPRRRSTQTGGSCQERGVGPSTAQRLETFEEQIFFVMSRYSLVVAAMLITLRLLMIIAKEGMRPRPK